MPPEGITLQLDRQLLDPERPPLPAHKFFWTRVGGDVVFEIGFFDLPELRDALEKSRQSNLQEKVRVAIAGRYALSPAAALELLKQAQLLVDDLKSQGFLPPER